MAKRLRIIANNNILVLFFLGICLCCNDAMGQLTSSGCQGETSYTDGQPNDPVFYFPAGQTGDLIVLPEVAGSSFNFVWYRFTPGSFNWTAFTTQNNQAASTLTNLQPGAYFVSIRNTTNAIVGCYRAWIAQVLQEPQVEVQPIPSNCVGPISLVGSFVPGQVTPITNLPESQLVIDANTQISVCFSGTHSWISDLAFYLRGPATCGSPNLVLMPNPGALGQPVACNNNNNINNLCFSTESTNNINVCNGMTSLTGTYGTYGPLAVPINWPAIYGCDGMNGGWSVQIYDCVNLDVGALTDATITFTGFDLCGASQTVSYTTPNGFSSAIDDNSCSSASASIFTVAPAIVPATLNCTFGYEWTSNPPVNIPNATNSLNIDLTTLTDLSGNPVAWQDIDFTLSTTINCDLLAAGNDCFGGNQSDTKPYVNIPQTVTTITPVAPICAEEGPVQLEVDVLGGEWSGPGIIDPVAGTFDPQINGEGFFDINVSFADPCILPSDVTLEVGVLPMASINFDDDVCADLPPFELTVSGMDGVFSGNGITNATLGTFNPASAGVGSHTVTFTSSTICPLVLNETINVQPLPDLIVNDDMEVCPGDFVQLIASGSDSYQWMPTANLSDPNAPDPIVTVDASIEYILSGTSVFGCTSMDTVALNLLPEPQLFVDPVSILCPGDLITLTALGSSGLWSWQIAGGIEIGNQQTIDVAPLVSTEYAVSVTDACDNVAQFTVEVPVESGFIADAGNDIILCSGQSVDISALAAGVGAQIQWTTVDGAINGPDNTADLNVSDEGTYTLNVVSPLGCIYIDEVFVDQVPLPNVLAGADAAVCSNQPYSLNASGALNYSWSPSSGLNNPTSSFTDAVINSPITYTVTGIDGNGCESSDEVSLTIIPAPQLSAQDVAMICPGEEVELVVAGTEGNYQWSPATNLNTTFGEVVVANPDVTTVYTVTLTDVCGVVLTVEVNVTVESGYSVSTGEDTFFCEGGEVILTAQITGAGAQFIWSTNDGIIDGNEIQPQITAQGEGTYLATITSPLQCQYWADVFVDEIFYPNFNLPDTALFCPNESLELSVGGPWDFTLWSGGLTGSNVVVSNEGSYTVTVAQDGCAISDTIYVNQVELPYINLGPDVEFCQETTVDLNAGYIGQWSNGFVSDMITVASAGTYGFTYTTEGCSVYDEINVSMIPLPYYSAAATQFACIGSPYIINLDGIDDAQYVWSTGGELPYLEVDQPGTYWATITNQCGSKVASIDVIFEDCESAVYTPTSFTPNNDGLNDVWQIITRNVESLQVKVMNRWGQVVFESTELNPVWTGGFNGGDTYVQDGLYFYRVEFLLSNGLKDLQEGWMFIVR